MAKVCGGCGGPAYAYRSIRYGDFCCSSLCMQMVYERHNDNTLLHPRKPELPAERSMKPLQPLPTPSKLSESSVEPGPSPSPSPPPFPLTD